MLVIAAEPLRAGAPALLVAFKPRTAMRAILERAEREPVVLLVVAAFLSVAVGGGEWKLASQLAAKSGWTMALLMSFGVLLAVCAIFVALFYGFAWFTTHSGRLLGATGSVSDVRKALAWGLLPWIWGLLFRLPSLILWPAASSVVYDPPANSGIRIGDGSLTLHGGAPVGTAPFWQVALLTVLELGVFVWYVWVGSRTLAEAQRVSPWKGLANLVLALILPAGAMLVAVISAIILKEG